MLELGDERVDRVRECGPGWWGVYSRHDTQRAFEPIPSPDAAQSVFEL
jgi:hypothetical protein